MANLQAVGASDTLTDAALLFSGRFFMCWYQHLRSALGRKEYL